MSKSWARVCPGARNRVAKQLSRRDLPDRSLRLLRGAASLKHDLHHILQVDALPLSPPPPGAAQLKHWIVRVSTLPVVNLSAAFGGAASLKRRGQAHRCGRADRLSASYAGAASLKRDLGHRCVTGRPSASLGETASLK